MRNGEADSWRNIAITLIEYFRAEDIFKLTWMMAMTERDSWMRLPPQGAASRASGQTRSQIMRGLYRQHYASQAIFKARWTGLLLADDCQRLGKLHLGSFR